MTAVLHAGRWRSWGRVVDEPHRIASPFHRADLPGALRAARETGPALAVGLGRSYGDSNLNPEGAVLAMGGLDRLLAFDPATGILRAEAGASLWDVLAFAIPRGFFLPTTPGTRFVTLGGAVANDVHGKNHHRAGTFGNHVTALGLVRSDGAATVRPGEPLFAATVGGLGLTGVIEWVELALAPVPSSLIDQEIVPFENLDAFFALAEESEATHEHTVAWIDCLARGASLGRGIFSRGNVAPEGPLEVRPRPAARRVPADAPGFLLNRHSLGAFNALYYRLQRRKAGPSRVPYDGFFYPLDAIGDWNRLYGRRGFYQYQSVVPPAAAREATREMLRVIAEAGEGSFLAVLKTFGGRTSPGLLSFPMEGTTLALDFPNRGAATLALMDRLDAVVREARGRLYPAKDGRIPPDLFRSGYPALDRFAAHVDPALGSRFWRRVAGGAP